MSITVKNVKIAEFMSEETLCFTATVYQDGKRIGEAKNDGHGGCTFVYLDNPREYENVYNVDLEEKVDELVYAIDAERQNKKILKQVERACLKGICVGVINEHGASYYQQGFKGKPLLADIARKPQGLAAIQKMVDRIKTELKGDEKILNTNLQALGIKI